MNLPSTILLKKNMLIELIGGNYAVEDGLVNGVEGVFRFYTTRKIDIVWVEFTDQIVGSMQRATMRHLYKPGIIDTWTPITRICRQIQSIHKTFFSREQFPIQLACARTIHRS